MPAGLTVFEWGERYVLGIARDEADAEHVREIRFEAPDH